MIEVDGLIHSEPDVIEYDRRRDETLRQMNLTLLRFSNQEVLEDFDYVLKKIFETLNASSTK